MNEEMREFAEEMQEFLRKGHRLLGKMGQGMGQRGGYGSRGGYGNRNMGNRDGGQYDSGMGQREWQEMGYDPRYI